MKYWQWENYKFVLLIVDSYLDSKNNNYGGFCGFYINIDSIETTTDKTGKECFIAEAQYGHDESYWFIISYTDDMENCYIISKEGEHDLIKCCNYGKSWELTHGKLK